MILLTVDEDPTVIQHTLAILKKAGGSHEVHTASNLAVAENSSRELTRLDVLITPAITGNGQTSFAFRDRLRKRFPKLHVLFLDDRDLSRFTAQIGRDPVLPKRPDERALSAWARSIGFGILPDPPNIPESAPHSEPLLDGSPEPADHHIPIAAAADDDAADEELPVAGLVTTPIDHLGDYKLVRAIASHNQTETYEAVQLSIGRTVALVLLKPELCQDTEAVREFRGAVRAKASVSHPYITPVYEAHEEDGTIFYTRELVEGLNLPQLAGTGKKINQRALIQIVKVTSECLKFMEAHGIKHSDLEPRHIYLGQDAQVRINNIAALAPKNLSNPALDIAKIARTIRPLVSEKPTENNLILPLLREMETQQYHSWGALLTKAHELENKVEEGQTYSVSGRTPLGATSNSKKAIAAAIAATATLAAIAAIFILPKLSNPKPIAAHDMLLIPAGSFIYQDGENSSILKPFWIDKYEVTIAQYAEFLAALREAPTTEYDHPDQAEKAPGKTGHTPDDWDAYYTAATHAGMFRDSPINVNCPVILVDWWDAYAYAKWKGHRLPTEEEWSKAARGDNGNIYPWGNEIDFKRFNSSDENGDRFSKWSPVDAMPGDVSPYGVIDTAGNVSEWTASWDIHPEHFDRTVPIVRGGNFASPVERYPLTDRRHSLSAEDRGIYTGFRTITTTDPNLSPN